MSKLNNTMMDKAAEGDLEAVKLLLVAGADVSADDNWAIQIASRKGHLEIVKLLIANGADVTAGNNEAIRGASSQGHVEVVKLLEAAKAVSKQKITLEVTEKQLKAIEAIMLLDE